MKRSDPTVRQDANAPIPKAQCGDYSQLRSKCCCRASTPAGKTIRGITGG